MARIVGKQEVMRARQPSIERASLSVSRWPA
jgi:hypothetical protein